MNDQPLKILHSVFGYERFRAPQEEVIGTLMAGRDALVLMPTGGGKSLCFQIPAIARAGTGIVVSPLIALMQDQVAALTQAGVRAAFLNSTLDAGQARAIETQLLRGEPGGDFVHALARQAIDDAGIVGVLVADEAQQSVAGAGTVARLADAIADVGAVETADEHARVFELEAFDDGFEVEDFVRFVVLT